MAKSIKKAPTRKPAAKAAKKASPRKKSSTLQRLEGAILSTVAEADEIAVEMGLAGAVPPKGKQKNTGR